jgi:hypothetical protein
VADSIQQAKADVDRSTELHALLYRQVPGTGEEVYVYAQLFNAAIRRGEHMACGWSEQW